MRPERFKFTAVAEGTRSGDILVAGFGCRGNGACGVWRGDRNVATPCQPLAILAHHLRIGHAILLCERALELLEADRGGEARRAAPQTGVIAIGRRQDPATVPAICDALLAVGAVIRGETDHYEFICRATMEGLMQVALQFGIALQNYNALRSVASPRITLVSKSRDQGWPSRPVAIFGRDCTYLSPAGGVHSRMPIATTSSGLILLFGSLPKNFFTSSIIFGMRVWPVSGSTHGNGDRKSVV